MYLESQISTPSYAFRGGKCCSPHGLLECNLVFPSCGLSEGHRRVEGKHPVVGGAAVAFCPREADRRVKVISGSAALLHPRLLRPFRGSFLTLQRLERGCAKESIWVSIEKLMNSDDEVVPHFVAGE
jgi:hypothetical protein